MHIIECYVENFGKLHQYTYKANQGLNVICEGNGSGKTTLAAFIRAMFYGMPATRTKKTLDDAERRKYKPWQGGLWGGNLCIEVSGKCYRIERTFADRDSQDTFRLLDMNTGFVSEDYSRNIGEELFGIDRAGFGASIYIANHDLRVSFNDSLSARIGQQPLEAEDLNHYALAMELLNQEYKKYGRNGKPHVLQELEELQGMYEKKKEQYDALAMVSAPQVMNAYPQWKLTAAELERLEQLDDFFGAGMPSKEQLRHYEGILTRCRNLYRQHLASVLQQAKQDSGVQELSLQRRHSDSATKKRRGGSSYQGIFITTGFMTLTIICFVLCNIILEYRTGLFLTGCVLAGVTILLMLRRFGCFQKRNVGDEEMPEDDQRNIKKEVLGQLRRCLQESERFLDGYGLLEHITYEDISEQIEVFNEKLTLLNQFRMEYEHLSEKDRDYRQALAQLQQKEKQFAEDVYGRERNKIGEEIRSMEEKILVLEQQYKVAKEKMEITEKTKKLLEAAHDELMAGYLSGVGKHFQKYMHMFDSQLADRLKLDAAFQVGIDEGGAMCEMDYYSQGYKDVIQLCQRLALTEALFQKEKPFIILDDPFVNLDDEMLGRAKHALEILSENMQVIYFTCSWTREPEDFSCFSSGFEV